MTVRAIVATPKGQGRTLLGVAGDVDRAVAWLMSLDPVERDGVFIMAVNNAIWPLEGCERKSAGMPVAIDAAGSLHGNLLCSWLERREMAGHNRPGIVVSTSMPTGVTIDLGGSLQIASSGMLPAFVGHLWGFDRVVLAGVRLDVRGYSRYQAGVRRMAMQGKLNNVACLTPGHVREFLLDLNGIEISPGIDPAGADTQKQSMDNQGPDRGCQGFNFWRGE